MLAWQVASMAYAPSKVSSLKGMARKLPCTGLHSDVRPSYMRVSSPKVRPLVWVYVRRGRLDDCYSARPSKEPCQV